MESYRVVSLQLYRIEKKFLKSFISTPLLLIKRFESTVVSGWTLLANCSQSYFCCSIFGGGGNSFLPYIVNGPKIFGERLFYCCNSDILKRHELLVTSFLKHQFWVWSEYMWCMEYASGFLFTLSQSQDNLKTTPICCLLTLIPTRNDYVSSLWPRFYKVVLISSSCIRSGIYVLATVLDTAWDFGRNKDIKHGRSYALNLLSDDLHNYALMWCRVRSRVHRGTPSETNKCRFSPRCRSPSGGFSLMGASGQESL